MDAEALWLVKEESCWLGVSVSPEDQLAAEAASQALESFPPLPLPPFGLPLCWFFWPAESFGSLEDLWSVLGAQSWNGLFPLEEDLLS